MKLKIIILLIIICSFFSCKIDQDNRLNLETCYLPELNENVTCGTFEVMENPLVRKGKKVRIKFMILPAKSSNSAPDPVFVFDGGPGVGAADNYNGWAVRLDKLRNDRDLILIDQRGTGDSSPLHCSRIGDPNKAQTYLKDMFTDEYVKNCKKELEKQYNLRYYHTVLAIDDTDAIREALGYKKINVVGGSYGTYFGLLYMKHYAQNVRAAFLFSVAPPNWNYPGCLAQDTEMALQRLFEDCAADPDCATDYPAFREELLALLATLKQGPISTSITNPINQNPETVTFTYNNFIHVIRAMLYHNRRSKWIPAFVYWAYRGIWFPLVEYAVSYFEVTNKFLTDGMLLCVTCSETIPFINIPQALKDAEGTFMGTYRIDQQTRACDLWVQGDFTDGFTNLVELNIPTLLLSGEIDPVTPPYHAEIVIEYLPNGMHVVIPNSAHGTGDVWGDCLEDIVVQFFTDGSVSNLDPSCADFNTRPPFVSWRDYASYNPEELSNVIRSLKLFNF